MRSVGRNEGVSDVIIRKAKTDDVEVIVSFIRMMLKEMSDMGGHPENQDESFWKSFIDIVLPAIENSDRLYLIAENNDGPVGFIEGRVDILFKVFEPKKSFHINSVYVNPEKRNKDIATNLLRAGLSWATEKGCQETDLHTLFNNSKAQGLYKKVGFTIFQYEMRMQLPTSP
jgi:ribosomal protein S18 acetylase RimI-like enzyme